MVKLATPVLKAIKLYRHEGAGTLARAVLYRIARMLWRKYIKLDFDDTKIKMVPPPYGLYKTLCYLYDTEQLVYKSLISNLKPTDVFWDVGAHLGMYTLLVGKHLRDGVVVAFEPDPAVVKFLKENVVLNGLDNVTIIEQALWDTDGVGILSYKLGGVVRESGSHDDGQRVKCVRGDNLVSQFGVPAPDIVKIDVEGGEIQVVNGLGSLLKKIRVLLIQVHPTKGGNVEKLKEILHREDFRLTTLGKRMFGTHETIWVKAIKQSVDSGREA